MYIVVHTMYLYNLHLYMYKRICIRALIRDYYYMRRGPNDRRKKISYIVCRMNIFPERFRVAARNSD